MKKVAIFYLCHSGSTKGIAEKIKRLTNGVLFEVNPSKDYPNTQKSPIQVIEKEDVLNPHPIQVDKFPDVSKFDIVLFGYPNWWEGIPEPIKILVQQLRLIDKEVAAFCTHEGARSHKKSTDIKPYFPYSKVLEGITLRNEKDLDDELALWIEKSIL
mgnify:CR=1 FL=1